MSFPSTLSELIQISQEPQANPFATALKFLNAKTTVESDATISLTLLVSVVTYVVIFCVCIAIICLPNLQGPGGHARRRWIIKRHYLDGYKRPYWIPNSGLVVAVCHLIGSTIFMVFLGLRYHALQSAFQGTTLHASAWFELRWFPAYCSFFTQAWSTWFLRASNASVHGSRRLVIDPITFNANLVILPVGVFVSAIIMISEQAAAVNAQAQITKKLIESLEVAAVEWERGVRLASSPQFHTATSDYSDFVNKAGAALLSIRTIGLFWTLMGIPTIIIYVFGVSTLLHVIWKSFQAVDSELDQNSHSDSLSITKPTVQPKKKSRKLRHSFVYLGLHYFSMSIVLTYHIIIGLIYYLASVENFLKRNFQAIFLVLSDSGSFFLLIALLVQLVRIILEGQEQKSKTIKTSNKKLEYEESVNSFQQCNEDIHLMT